MGGSNRSRALEKHRSSIHNHQTAIEGEKRKDGKHGDGTEWPTHESPTFAVVKMWPCVECLSSTAVKRITRGAWSKEQGAGKSPSRYISQPSRSFLLERQNRGGNCFPPKIKPLNPALSTRPIARRPSNAKKAAQEGGRPSVQRFLQV